MADSRPRGYPAIERISRYGRPIRPTERMAVMMNNTLGQRYDKHYRALYALSQDLYGKIRTRRCSLRECRSDYEQWRNIQRQMVHVETDYRSLLDPIDLRNHLKIRRERDRFFDEFESDIQQFCIMKERTNQDDTDSDSQAGSHTSQHIETSSPQRVAFPQGVADMSQHRLAMESQEVENELMITELRIAQYEKELGLRHKTQTKTESQPIDPGDRDSVLPIRDNISRNYSDVSRGQPVRSSQHVLQPMHSSTPRVTREYATRHVSRDKRQVRDMSCDDIDPRILHEQDHRVVRAHLGEGRYFHRDIENDEVTPPLPNKQMDRGYASDMVHNPTGEHQIYKPSDYDTERVPEVLDADYVAQIPGKGVDMQIVSLPRTAKQGSSADRQVSQSGEYDVLNKLADLLANKQERLPRMEPEIYDGNLLKFPVWMKSFEAIIERHTDSPSERLYFLGKYTTGDAKRAIQGLFALDNQEAYTKAKDILTKRYGNKYKVSEAFRERLASWPTMKPGDGKGLQEFSDFLGHCNTAMASISYLRSLNSAEENKKLIHKLPRYVADRWNRTIDRWLWGNNSEQPDTREGDYPPFSTFCKFIENEARIACGPGNLRVEDTKKATNEKPARSSRPRNAGNFSSHASDTSHQSICTQKSTNTERPSVHVKPLCVLCKGQHAVETCNEFLRMSADDRKSVAMRHGLCLGCLRRGHLYRDCKRRQPGLLLGNRTEQGSSAQQKNDVVAIQPHNKEAKSVISHKVEITDTESEVGCHHSMIIPVKLYHRDNPGNQVTTYALLDNQSNACFITETLLQKFCAPTENVNLKLTTMLDQKVISSEMAHGLVMRGLSEQTEVPLPGTYSRSDIPAERSLIPRPETVEHWPHLQGVSKQLYPYQEDIDIGLLIGFNCSAALLPREVIVAGNNDPYAVRTTLGWGVTGLVNRQRGDYGTSISDGSNTKKEECSHFAFRTHVKETSSSQIKQMFDLDFNEKTSGDKISVEDRRFLKQVGEGIHKRNDGHFEMPLPFKEDALKLPDNKIMAVKRLSGLKARLKGNIKYRKDYITYMQDIIDKGYAERVPAEESSLKNGSVWYIPHHGVYHPNKPDKIRVVFDCSAEYQGEVLNRHLLQGPDLINNLGGVLCRFRQESIAIVCDIEGMFLQVGVTPEHRNFLRFLWYENGDVDEPPVEYRMTAHLFGASSSPGCANYALKTAADTYEKDCGTAAANFVRQNFYVDDGLTSVATSDEATRLVDSSSELCRLGGFNLHKFACTDKKVISAMPLEKQAKDIQDLDLAHDELPMTRTLGMQWCIESDTFHFRIELKDTPLTRRGILSSVSSVFDPIGLVAPFLLKGKQILQDICRDGGEWDDPVPEEIQYRWQRWRHELSLLSELRIPRCYKPKDFGIPSTVELHHFSDASQNGYGQCSYLRLTNDEGRVSSALVMAKSRVAPSKPVTIPRLELTAAVVSVRVGTLLDKELSYKHITHIYWTDSKVVLGYIANETRRFHIFVANRVQQIRDHTTVEQWNHVDTKSNPADLASRGMSAKEMIGNCTWWQGPPFLSSASPLPLTKSETTLPVDDPEVKKASVHAVRVGTDNPSDLLTRLEYFSSWHRAKRAVALCMRLRMKLQARIGKGQMTPEGIQVSKKAMDQEYVPVSVEEMLCAERVIIKAAQVHAFPRERDALLSMGAYAKEQRQVNQRKHAIKRNSCIYRLDPYIGSDGLIRVGGRVRRANVPCDLAHPVMLPRQGHVTELVIEHYHQRTCHSGRETTLNEIRGSGYWIIKARAAVTAHVWKCITCRKLRGATAGQKMANLPSDRLEPAPPFTYSGVDFFGPFYVKEGRSEKKRWGALFTCLVTRAIHIEVAHTLSTDSFLNAYRRFIGRRGPIRQLRCDRGTNFVGAKNELEAALTEMCNSQIRRELAKEGCDWFEFRMNVPHASHMGGVWERMIRSARTVLSALLDQHSTQLDDELLCTLMIEAEAIVNSRPLTYVDMTSPDSAEPLTPSQLLTFKSKVVMPPPGRFIKEDMYCRRRWRRVQFLANEFWIRWRKEYLPTLQERRKWTRPQQDLEKGDIVLMSDEQSPRCQWPRAIVEDTYPGEDMRVRKVLVRTPTSKFERPVHKLILLHRPVTTTREPTQDRESPPREPVNS